MGNRRVLILVIAVALAGLTAFLTFHYASSADERAFKGQQLVSVYLVKKDIPKGFPGEKALDEGYIARDCIPRKYFFAQCPLRLKTSANSLSAKSSASRITLALTSGMRSGSFPLNRKPARASLSQAKTVLFPRLFLPMTPAENWMSLTGTPCLSRRMTMAQPKASPS